MALYRAGKSGIRRAPGLLLLLLLLVGDEGLRSKEELLVTPLLVSFRVKNNQ